jgi:hypothetical protein
MKKLILFVLLFVSVILFGQTKGITYQAVIYNPEKSEMPGQSSTQSPLTNKSVCMSFELSDSRGNIAYKEIIETTTDAFGMVNLIIGIGTQTGGYVASFNTIVWDEQISDLRVSLDADGSCSSFTEISNQPFNWIPFALHAATSTVTTGGEVAVNKSAATTLGTSDVLYPTQNAVKTYVDLAIIDAAAADATTTASGKIQLAGDLAGTAALPTVPGLALKENTANKSTATTLGTSDALYPSQNAVKTYVDTQVAGTTITDANNTTKGKIQLAGDLAGTAASPTITDAAVIAKVLTGFSSAAGTVAVTDNVLQGFGKIDGNVALKAPLASPTFTGTVSGIDKTMVGLTNVDNTTDLLKPVSTATQVALDLKSNLASPTFTGTPTLPTGTIGVTQAAGNTTTALATTAFVTDAVTSGTIADADASTKGKIQLAGDLAGTAASPTITNAAVIAKVLTGFSSAAGTVAVTDNVLEGLQKIDGNVALKAPLASPTFTGMVTIPTPFTLGATSVITTGTQLDYINTATGTTGTNTTNIVYSTSPTLVTPVIGAATGTSLSVSGQLSSTVATGTAPLTVVSTTEVANLRAAAATNLAAGLGGQLPYQSAAGTTVMLANGSANQVLQSNGTTLAPTWATVSVVREAADEFTATAAQTSFTLIQTPSVNSKVKMYINGIRISNSAYTLSGTKVTYVPANNGTYALTAGDRIQFYYTIAAEAVSANGATGVGSDGKVPIPTAQTPSVTSSTGKIWMDRNLGATQVATSSTDAASYGHLYQWGRGADGHHIRTSGTTSALSSTDVPGNANFIIVNTSPFDWRQSQSSSLWQGASGINNPCPAGYRLPTKAELNAERLAFSSNDAAGAFASPLKLPMAGSRDSSSGSLGNVGSSGHYWASAVSGTFASFGYFNSRSAGMYTYYRADGFSVRCLKD